MAQRDSAVTPFCIKISPTTQSNGNRETILLLELESIHPGFTADNVQSNTGFDLNISDPIPVTAPVTQTVTAGETEVVSEDTADDVLQIEGTDLLAAPLAKRFYSVNSVANINRNASNDLIGDIAIPYDENYSPWYQSAIRGDPIHSNPLQ